jgi:hypothetical protein
MTKPVVLVCGCEKYRTMLLTAIKRFTNSSGWITVGCIGKPSLTEPVFDASESIVYLPVSDTYEALPIKIWTAFTWIMKTWPDTPGIFKTDDDILCDLPRKTLIVNQAIPYWGFVVSRCMENNINPARIQARFADKTLRPRHDAAIYCFGHGYWIGRAAFPAILSSRADYERSYLEDVCTGFVMNRAGFIPKHLPLKYKEMPRTQ